MASLEELLKKRRICRLRYTKNEKLVVELQAAAELLIFEDGVMKGIELSIRESNAAFNKLNKIYDELSGIQDQIDYHPENEDRLKTDADDREELYTKAYMRVNAMNTYLDTVLSKPFEPSEKEGSKEGSNSISPDQFTECFTRALKTMNTGVTEEQLQKILATLTHKKRVIQIPKFKGDCDLFDQWKELVESEVQKPGYSEVEKAHLTVSLLDGEVAKLVASLKDPTYEDIIEFLENRYGDVLARVERAVSEIASVSVVTTTSVKELEPFYNKLIANWNYIQKRTRDKPIVESSWILTALVRTKLPKSLMKRWDGERIKDEKRTHVKANFPICFDELLEKLNDALQVARRAEPFAVSTTTAKVKTESHRDRPKSSSYALNVAKKDASQTTSKSAERGCSFCDSDHPSYSCPKVKDMNVNERCDRVKGSGACFNCLRRGHFVHLCKASHCKVCDKNHHTLLHRERRNPEEKTSKTGYRSSEKKDEKVESSAGLVKSVEGGQNEILMQTGVVKLESKCAITQGRVLFDSGSGVSFISRKMAKKLALSGPKVEAEFTLAGGGVMCLKTERVKFHLSSALPNWKGETFEIVAYVMDKPSADMGKVKLDVSKMTHLRGLQLADTYPRGQSCEIDVMLGIEDSMNILLDKRIKGPRGTPVAQKSHIGWILCGSCSTKPERECIPGVNRVSFHLKDETEIAIHHWETEHIGIMPNESKGQTDLEMYALQQHAEKTHRVDDRFETGLLRHPKYIDRRLRNNKSLAVNRLIGLERRLQKDASLAEQYKAQIQDLLANDRAEKVNEKQEPEDRQVWYLPHHPVVKMDRLTTKVRVVFDGSMVGHEGVSLNDTLLPGPALQPDLPGVLMRFRRHKVAIVADIEKMFLQVRMRDVDRDMQRFLWRDLDPTKEPEVYRLTTVTFGLTTSPFSSIQTVLDHVKSQRDAYPKAVKEIEENIFVDDVLSGEDNVEMAAILALDLKNVLKPGGFPLRKFQSNKPEALYLLEENDLASKHTKTVIGSEIATKTATKTLGVKFDPTEDVLMFSFCDKMEDVGCETKRTVLKQLHRVFDPLGMVSPFTVVAKRIFQMSWMTGKGWDDPVPEDLEQMWLKWKSEVPILDEIKVKRCLIPDDFSTPTYTLHGFGDASEAAYGAAVYLRVADTGSTRVHTALLCSKTRVAPIGKKRTIPELELMAALITARLISYVVKELKLTIENKTCWTDSQVVLHWICQPAYTWQTFVSNRVSELQQLVEPNNWRHIPGKENPADLCSRGISAIALVESRLWWDGPEFLRSEETEWPKQKITVSEEATTLARSKAKTKMITACRVQAEKSPDSLLEYVKKYSTFNKFINVMLRVRSWMKRHRAKTEGRNELDPNTGLTLEDKRQEIMFWIRWAQQNSFNEEIELLKLGEDVPKSSKLLHLRPYWDNEKQVIRVGGRLNYTTLPEETKHPIILPTHNSFVEKLVLQNHTKNLHTGGAQTLASLRCRYWLVHGRQEVRRILHYCRVCREPVKLEQLMAPLPKERVSILPSYTNVGIDFAGPLYIRVPNGSEKVYICLFSCMVTRAIHLELVNDMSTETFLLALRRMMSRRGRCKLIVSDNAKTFKKASRILKGLFKDPKKLKEKLEDYGIEWRFITERAPWQGGFYERMVQSVKKPLKRVLGNSMLTHVELETVLTEVEAQVNSRPLTTVSSSSEDLSPITPGHLVIGRSPQVLPDVDCETKKMTLGKRWRYQQRLMKEFWNRWTKEYLLELNYMKKWVEIQANVKEGDVVLIAEDNQKKQDWLLGRVEATHPGRDGLVRSVTLKTPKGLRRRPIQRLRLLEAATSEEE